MAQVKGRLTGNVLVARVRDGEDLLSAVSSLALNSGFKAATIELIGAVHRAVLLYYNHHLKRYEEILIEEPMEIASGLGNVSLREGQPFCHIHLVLSDRQGRCVGGHLAQGTRVFLAEVVLKEMETDIPLERSHDQDSGLWVWK